MKINEKIYMYYIKINHYFRVYEFMLPVVQISKANAIFISVKQIQ